MTNYLSSFPEFAPLFLLKKVDGNLTVTWLTNETKSNKRNGVYFIVAGDKDWKIGMHTGGLSALMSRYKTGRAKDAIRHRAEWEELFERGEEVVFYGYLPPTEYNYVSYPQGTIKVEKAIGKALEKQYQKHYIDLIGELPFGNFGERSHKTRDQL